MGNNASTSTLQSDINENLYDNDSGSTRSSYSRTSSPKSSPEYYAPPSYPAFKPTLFLADIGPEDVNLSNKSKRRKQKKQPFRPKSVLYIFGPDKRRYMIKFRAGNPQFAFIEAKSRPAIDAQRTRSTQTNAKTKLVSEPFASFNRQFFRKEYKLKRRDPKVEYKSPKFTCDDAPRSLIYVEKDGMEFLLAINGDLTVATTYLYDAPLEKLGPCKATLLMQVISEGDICQVDFDLEDVEFASLMMETSRGCQTSDPYTYFKTRGCVNQCMIVPVPITTYRYEDPMVGIRHQNFQQHMRGGEPGWMTKARRKRLCDPLRLKEDSRFPGLFKSSFTVERGGYAFKACTGLIKGRLLSGFTLYDEFVRTHFSPEKKLTGEVLDLAATGFL